MTATNHEIAVESHHNDEHGLRFRAVIYQAIPSEEDDALPLRGRVEHDGPTFRSHHEAVAYALGWLASKR